MRFDVFTLFPGIFESPLKESMLKRAIESGLLDVQLHNIRDYAAGRHQVTDDYPYGGGGGMVMKPEPVFAAVESV
jgi:tRNA (guanine37-N1)-methyltransferase